MGELKTQDVVIEGIRSPVRSCAPEGREQDTDAVVFVHGNPGSGEDWLGLLPQVGQLARAVAPDMPGYGKADRPRDFAYTVPGYGAHLAKLLDALGIERVHLVLHDFGGPWGLQLAAEHPERVLSLTLINIGVLRGYRWHKFARIWRTPILGELFQLSARLGPASMFHALLSADNPKPFPREFTDRMFADSDWAMSRGMLALYRDTSDPSGATVALGETLKPHRIKTLVLWGDGDAYLPLLHAEQQKDYFDAEVHVLPGCGHWPMIDEPEQVAGLVVPFLRARIEAARGAASAQVG